MEEESETEKNVGKVNNLQHDLEKLQESHDILLSKIKEKDDLIGNVHHQLDKMVEDKDELKKLLDEKESDLLTVEDIIKQKDERIKELEENEAKLSKMKAFAVKLKKELADTREELKKDGDEKDLVKQITKERDKFLSQYQQSVRNFQNLQLQYDNLHDDFDKLKAKHKTTETDLTNATLELNKIREEFEENKDEIECLKKTIETMQITIDEEKTKYQGIESKMIVQENELEKAKKKIINQSGMEHTLLELKNQIDIKTTEVVELGESVEKYKIKENELEELKFKMKEFIVQLDEQKEINESLKENVRVLEKQIESANSGYEQEKINTVEFVEEISVLKQKLKNYEDNYAKIQKSTDLKIKELQETKNFSEEELKRTKEEFDSYKVRVCKVLNEKKEDKFIQQIKNLKREIEDKQDELEEFQKKMQLESGEKSELQSRIDSLSSHNKNLSQEASKIEPLVKENETLKSLSRDLQYKLVTERSLLEKQLAEKEESFTAEKVKLMSQIDEEKSVTRSLKENMDKIKNSNSNSLIVEDATITRQSSSTPSNHSNSNSITLTNPNDAKIMENGIKDDSLDLESVETTSIPSTRFNRVSSITSFFANPLHEILNPVKKEDDELSEQNTNKMQRLSEILQESESNNMLLAEQNRVLKDEIRRLERSIERVEMVENLEYLKNVLIKFLSLDGTSSERIQLIPVLKTILKLNNDEEALLERVSQNDGKSESADDVTWANYLWNGFS